MLLMATINGDELSSDSLAAYLQITHCRGAVTAEMCAFVTFGPLCEQDAGQDGPLAWVIRAFLCFSQQKHIFNQILKKTNHRDDSHLPQKAQETIVMHSTFYKRNSTTIQQTRFRHMTHEICWLPNSISLQ